MLHFLNAEQQLLYRVYSIVQGPSCGISFRTCFASDLSSSSPLCCSYSLKVAIAVPNMLIMQDKMHILYMLTWTTHMHGYAYIFYLQCICIYDVVAQNVFFYFYLKSFNPSFLFKRVQICFLKKKKLKANLASF